MKETDTNLYARALALGIVCGMRSLLAPALISRKLAEQNGAPAGSPEQKMLKEMGSPAVTTALGIIAVGELAADKLPMTPSRTILPSVLFRTLSGAVVGALFSTSRGGDRTVGAALGAVGAVAGTYGGYELRRLITKELGVPNIAAGVIEDLAATGICIKALES
jgi:uncharacterized membrane protein